MRGESVDSDSSFDFRVRSLVSILRFNPVVIYCAIGRCKRIAIMRSNQSRKDKPLKTSVSFSAICEFSLLKYVCYSVCQIGCLNVIGTPVSGWVGAFARLEFSGFWFSGFRGSDASSCSSVRSPHQMIITKSGPLRIRKKKKQTPVWFFEKIVPFLIQKIAVNLPKKLKQRMLYRSCQLVKSNSW